MEEYPSRVIDKNIYVK